MNNKGQTIVEWLLATAVTVVVFVMIVRAVDAKVIRPLEKWTKEHYRSENEIHRDIADLFERQELATSLRRCLDEKK